MVQSSMLSWMGKQMKKVLWVGSFLAIIAVAFAAVRIWDLPTSLVGFIAAIIMLVVYAIVPFAINERKQKDKGTKKKKVGK
tara:strand:- start:35 stop:277 length:243 start_codon:yes stop_codon:yes gene_type:complete